MKFTVWDLMKLAQTYDGEFDAADFSNEELKCLLNIADDCQTIDELKERYFDYYDDIKDKTQNKHKWSD